MSIQLIFFCFDPSRPEFITEKHNLKKKSQEDYRKLKVIMELLTNFSACIGCRLVYSGKITKKRYSSKMYFKRCTNGEWALLSALQGISTSQTIAGLHWAANITRKVKVQERTFTTDHNHSFFFPFYFLAWDCSRFCSNCYL